MREKAGKTKGNEKGRTRRELEGDYFAREVIRGSINQISHRSAPFIPPRVRPLFLLNPLSPRSESMRDEIALRKNWLDAWPCPFTLIEPGIGSTPGCPDGHFSLAHRDGFIEFKVVKEGGTVLLEPSQRLWMLERSEVKPPLALVALHPGGWHCWSPWRQVVKGMPLSLPIPEWAASGDWEKGAPQWNAAKDAWGDR